MNNMKYMKQVKEYEDKGIPIKDLPPPPKSENSDYILCQSCGRKYSPMAFDRHSKVCSNIVNKPQALLRKAK